MFAFTTSRRRPTKSRPGQKASPRGKCTAALASRDREARREWIVIGLGEGGEPGRAVGSHRAFSSSTSTRSSNDSFARQRLHVGLLDGRVLGAIEVVHEGGLKTIRASTPPGRRTISVAPPSVDADALALLKLAERRRAPLVHERGTG